MSPMVKSRALRPEDCGLAGRKECRHEPAFVYHRSRTRLPLCSAVQKRSNWRNSTRQNMKSGRETNDCIQTVRMMGC